MVVVLAVGIAVSQQDHLAHRQAAAEDFALGDLERILEVGATARLKPLNTVEHLGANLAERPQMAENVGLRVKRDNADVVGIVELVEQSERRLLGVTDSLIVAHCRVARVVAHRIRTIDQQIDGEWFARGGGGCGSKVIGKVFSSVLSWNFESRKESPVTIRPPPKSATYRLSAC